MTASLPESAEIADCAQEEIRLPGAIQPHGRLAAIDPSTGRLLAWSRNWADADAARAAVASLDLDPGYFAPGEAPAPVGWLQVGGEKLEATAHLSGKQL
ncbi:MAG TPA: histidine kinase, partial [Lautropia sp.]|nr:histidine kinase [Lautropia sp.]